MNKKEFAELLQVPGALADRIFAEFDMDEDGHLDLFEFIAMLAHVTLQDVPKRLKAVFNIFDPDDKGVIEMDLFNQMVEAILKIPSLDVPSDAKVKAKIQELKTLYFLQENFVNLEQFSSMALSDKDIRNALTEIGIFSAKENITSSGDNDLEQELKKLHLNFVSEESMLKENVADKKKDIDTEIFELLDFKIANAKPLREFEKQLPSLTPDDFLFLPSSIEAPSLLVDLKYVYGIRSYDTRNNLFVNPEGQLIYHAACFGIKLDPVANKQMFIMPTKQEIVAMDSWNNLTVVGEISENPTLTIWDNTKMEIQGVLYNTFQNGIAMVRFSDDGNLIAVSTLDDKRSIFIVHMAMMMVIAKSAGPEDPLLDMRFLPDGNSIALATPTQFCFIEKSSRKMVVRASTGWGVDDKRYATTLSIAINGTDPIVGTIDGRLLVFKGTHLFSSIQAHKGPVNSIVSRKGDKGVVSAATSKIIFWNDNLEKEHEVDIGNAPFVWNPKIRAVTFTPDEKHIYVSTRSGNVLHVDREGGVKMLMCSHSNGSLKGLASLNRSPDFVTCGQDSLVARWNSTENTIINCKQLPFPAEKICVSGDDKLLAVGCSNGLVLLINADTLNVMSSIKDRYREIQCIGFSPNNTMLAVGSADCSLFVYEIKKLGSPVILKGHKNGVANLDWSKDNQYLRSCTDNGEVLYWNLSDPTVALKTLESLKNMEWNTCNCPYTWETQAITPPQEAAIDVYSVDRSPDFNYIASTNSIGQIRIYRFPCTNIDANYTQAAGHGQQVTCVRFSCVQDRMYSLGGTDNCIIQWRLRPKPSETKFVNTEKFEMEEIENTKEPRESAGTKRSKRRRETKHQTLMRSSSIIQSEIVPMVNEVSMLTGVGEAGSTLKLQEDRDLIFLPATSAISAPVVKHDLPFEHIIAKSIPQNFKPNLKSKDPPDGNLYLKHVFGVRASDCKNTIKLLANDYEVVYPSGSLVIVTNMKTKKQRFFTGHLDDVIAIDLSSDRTMCVSAAVCDRNAPPERRETDYFIWDTTLMTEIGRVSGYHAGSARVVRFSPDSNVVLSVGRDDQHTLVVQNWKNDKMVCTAKIGTSPVYDADWSDKTHFVTVGKTHIKFWSIKLGNVNMVHGDWGQDEAEPLVCCKYIGRYCYTGSGDGNIAGWYDFKKGPNVKAHESPVYVLSFNSNKNLLISGGKDGMVKTWIANEFKIDAVATILDFSKYGSPEQEFIAIRSVDCVEFQVMEKQTGKGAGDDSYRYSQSEVTIVGTKSGDLIKYENGKFETVMQFHSREILSLTAHPTLSIFATSGADRTVRVWNAITGVGLPPLFVKDVVSSINWSPNGEYIVAGTDSGEVFLYTFNPFTRVAASKTIFAEKGCGILQIKFSPIILQNYFAVTGTEPCTQVQIMTQVGRELKNFGVIDTAFTGEIYRMDWSADSVYLRLNSSNGELGFANVGTLTIIEPENSTNIVWNEQSCPLALDSYGIFPVVPGLDVDCVARTSHKEVIATGDDFQQVKIFRFPANVEKCGCKTYLGHSSPITEITFMLNDNLLVTVGGKDKTIILWVTDFGNADSLRDDILEEEHGIQKRAEVDLRGNTIDNTLVEVGKTVFENDLFFQEDVNYEDDYDIIEPWRLEMIPPTTFSDIPIGQSLAPKIRITLEYAYGYRTKDTRNNLYYLSTGELVYHAASLMIIHNTDSNTQKHFDMNGYDIISIDVSRDGKLVYFGDENPRPSVVCWSPEQQKEIFRVKRGLADGVDNLSVSPTNKYLAATCSDFKHSIVIFDLENFTAPIMTGEAGEQTITCIVWITDEELILVGPKVYQYWNLKTLMEQDGTNASPRNDKPAEDTKLYKTGVLKEGADPILLCAALGPYGDVLTGSSQGEFCVWHKEVCITVEKLHRGPLDIIFALPGSPTPTPGNLTVARVLTGGKDGKINLLDEKYVKLSTLDIYTILPNCLDGDIRSLTMNPGKRIIALGLKSGEIYELKYVSLEKSIEIEVDKIKEVMKSHFSKSRGQETSEVCAVHPIRDAGLFLTCGDDGTVRVWSSIERTCKRVLDLNIDKDGMVLGLDPQTRSIRACSKLKAMDISSEWLTVGCADGTIRIVSLQLWKQVLMFKHRRSSVRCVEYSPDGTTLAIGYDGGQIDLYVVPSFFPLCKMQANNYSIRHIDWTTDSVYMQVENANFELLYFNAKKGIQLKEGAAMLKDAPWKNWSLTIGWPAQGIYSPDYPNEYFTCADRSKVIEELGYQLLAVGNSDGQVLVYKYPSLSPGSDFIELTGHSGPISEIRFDKASKTLFTLGSDDDTILQWKLQVSDI